MSKDKLYRTQAWAIQVDDFWFSGFTDRRKLPPQVSDVKLRTGLCEARLIWDDSKAEAYMRRLRERGLTPTLRLVAMIPNRSDLP